MLHNGICCMMIPDSFEEMTLAWDQTPCSVVGLFAPDHLEMGRNPTEPPIFVVVWDKTLVKRESKWSSPPLSLKGYSGGAITKSNIILYLFLNGFYCIYTVSKVYINFICSSKRIQLKYLKSSHDEVYNDKTLRANTNRMSKEKFPKCLLPSSFSLSIFYLFSFSWNSPCKKRLFWTILLQILFLNLTKISSFWGPPPGFPQKSPDML